VLGLVSVVSAPSSAATAILARYPYLTDLTSSSVAVTWATTSQDTSPGIVTYGPNASSCTQSVAVATQNPTTYTAFGETTPYYQHSVQILNLSASSSYCYRIYSGTTAPGAALLSEPPSFPATFTTLPAANDTGTFSFDVFGDWGETSTSNNAPLGTYNSYQDAILAQLAASARSTTNPALFAVSTGDIAYNDGSTTNYGDLNHPADGAGGAAERSNVFDARYWGKTGSSLPLFSTTGNHGRNNTFFSTWPESVNVSNSKGVYSNISYPAVDNQAAAKYPSSWYAFTVGGVRIYILDADWTDVSPTGNPTLGLGCTSACPSYQVDRDEHWQQMSAEYQWLAKDLQGDQASRGADAMRMAFFHYPLRVDQNNYTTQQDVYLQNSAANPNGGATSLEALLATNHVNLAFNGHAHLYERNVAPPGGVPNYVTGGGGGVLTNVAGSSACSGTDAYARGWDPGHAVGSSCGTPSLGGTAKPTAAAQVYHFLKVTVAGSDVSVNPTDSTGAVFDPVTYHFASDTTAPSIPGAPSAARVNTTSTNVAVTLGASSTDIVGVVAYDIYRDRAYRGTVPAGVTKWTDVNVPAGSHVWTVEARDQRGNASPESPPSNTITIADTTPPTAPGTPVAQPVSGSPQTMALSWSPSTDNIGVTGYNLYRNGTLLLAGVSGTSALDTTATDVTTYTYTVTALDAAGNVSASSPPCTVTTPDWTPPSPPILTAAGGPANELDLSWSGASDNVGVTGYDVYRDGVSTPVATGVTGTSWADTGLAAGSTHSYVVVARDAAGNASAPSNSVSATVSSVSTPVGPPGNLTASQLPTPGNVLVSWTAPSTGTASSYDVYRGTVQVASGITTTSVTDIGAPDGTPVAYSVTASDAAGNSATATTGLTPDWTAPSLPGNVTVTPLSTSSVSVSWTAATDAVGVTGYTVSRTDATGSSTKIADLATADPTTVTDTGRTPGSSYTYTVTARDAAGNTSSASATVAMPLFLETFEAGALSSSTNAWTTPTAGLTTQQATVHTGSWAAEENSTGSPTWASAQLPATYTAVHASAWVNVKSRSTSAGFLKLRTASGAYIAYLYVNASGYLSVRNDAGNVTHVSTTTVPINSWHKVDLYVNTNPGGPVTITAALDGATVTFSTPVGSTETLGSTPIGQIVLGDTVAGRIYDIAIDDLFVDTRAL
jgi:fibronectin type 3 domain-containing protein